MSHIFGSKIFNGIYIVGCDIFHQNLYFWVKNIENILYFWVLLTVTQHLQLHFIQYAPFPQIHLIVFRQVNIITMKNNSNIFGQTKNQKLCFAGFSLVGGDWGGPS